jgi:hypothetical protein
MFIDGCISSGSDSHMDNKNPTLAFGEGGDL